MRSVSSNAAVIEELHIYVLGHLYGHIGPCKTQAYQRTLQLLMVRLWPILVHKPADP